MYSDLKQVVSNINIHTVHVLYTVYTLYVFNLKCSPDLCYFGLRLSIQRTLQIKHIIACLQDYKSPSHIPV